MIDFIRLVLYSSGEVYLENLKQDRYGYYYLFSFKKVYIIIDRVTNRIEIKLSMMYCMQGHNFTYDRGLFMEGIKKLGEALHINLWKATVEELEFGVIMEVPFTPSDCIKSYHGKPEQRLIEDEKKRDRNDCRFWNDNMQKLYIKMYNPGKNLQNKVPKDIRNKIENYNSKSHYVKLEVHYKHPNRTLNNSREILLYQLLTPSWIARLKEDLLLQFERLYPTSNLTSPRTKSEASSIDLLLRMVWEYGTALGKSPKEIQKDYYDKLKRCSVLSTNNRKARQSQYRNAVKHLQFEIESSYDITKYLITALKKMDKMQINNNKKIK